jgi:hypothetical protein
MTIRKLEDLDAFDFPSAFRFGVYLCPKCNSAHVVLFDEEDTPIAQMTAKDPRLKALNYLCKEVFDEVRRR